MRKKNGKSLTGMKGLELRGGYCFVKGINGKKEHKSHKHGGKKKVWTWD